MKNAQQQVLPKILRKIEIRLFSNIDSFSMEVDAELSPLDESSRIVIMSGREHTQPGSVISNCIFLFGSPECDCGRCTKPCLHPLATEDLRQYFNVSTLTFNILLFYL